MNSNQIEFNLAIFLICMVNLRFRQLSLDDFILAILQVPIAQLQLAQLQDWVFRLKLKDDVFDRHITFQPGSYQRR